MNLFQNITAQITFVVKIDWHVLIGLAALEFLRSWTNYDQWPLEPRQADLIDLGFVISVMNFSLNAMKMKSEKMTSRRFIAKHQWSIELVSLFSKSLMSVSSRISCARREMLGLQPYFQNKRNCF
jgi:hypothetical protein